MFLSLYLVAPNIININKNNMYMYIYYSMHTTEERSKNTVHPILWCPVQLTHSSTPFTTLVAHLMARTAKLNTNSCGNFSPHKREPTTRLDAEPHNDDDGISPRQHKQSSICYHTHTCAFSFLHGCSVNTRAKIAPCILELYPIALLL